jgi:phytoene dehydrogenase-like protein
MRAPRRAAAAALLCALCALASPVPSSAAARRRLSAEPDEVLDVCIVGAGPAGIGAALALSDKGRSVALLEREAVAGGQTAYQYVDPASGFRVHMGAIVITPPDYPTVMEYARRTGVGVEARPRQAHRAAGASRRVSAR